VLRAALSLASVREDFLPPGGRPAYAEFLRRTFGARARALGWRARPDEDEELRLVRPMLLGLVAGDGEDTALGAEARRLAIAWLDDRAAVDADVAGTVLAVAARHGDRALFDRLRAELPRVRSPQERTRVLRALAAFRDPALVQAALDLTLDPAIDGKDALTLIPSDARVFPIVWRWFEQRFDALAARIPTEARRHLVSVGARFCDGDGRARAEGFFRPKLTTVPGGARLLAQALEIVDQCSAQRDAQRASLAEFLGHVTANLPPAHAPARTE
jgi:alanyl aminopeptidase